MKETMELILQNRNTKEKHYWDITQINVIDNNINLIATGVSTTLSSLNYKIISLKLKEQEKE